MANAAVKKAALNKVTDRMVGPITTPTEIYVMERSHKTGNFNIHEDDRERSTGGEEENKFFFRNSSEDEKLEYER